MQTQYIVVTYGTRFIKGLSVDVRELGNECNTDILVFYGVYHTVIVSTWSFLFDLSICTSISIAMTHLLKKS